VALRPTLSVWFAFIGVTYSIFKDFWSGTLQSAVFFVTLKGDRPLKKIFVNFSERAYNKKAELSKFSNPALGISP